MGWDGMGWAGKQAPSATCSRHIEIRFSDPKYSIYTLTGIPRRQEKLHFFQESMSRFLNRSVCPSDDLFPWWSLRWMACLRETRPGTYFTKDSLNLIQTQVLIIFPPTNTGHSHVGQLHSMVTQMAGPNKNTIGSQFHWLYRCAR